MTQKSKRGQEVIPKRSTLSEQLAHYPDDILRQNADLSTFADELEYRRVERKLNSNKEQHPKQ